MTITARWCDMVASHPTILATSGGYRPGERAYLEFSPLFHYGVELAGVAARRPKVTYIGTAGGDQRAANAHMHEAAQLAGIDLTCLNLFPMPNLADISGHLLSQDMVWVQGGSVANLLAVWQVHDLAPALRAAWEAGVVLAGVSAGSICWYQGGCTDSFGPELRAVTNGLGFLPYGNGVHYDSESRRRPTIHRLVADGTLGTTHCTDDGVGLVYHGTELVEAVCDIDGKGAFIVQREADGSVTEERIRPRRLPE